MYALKSFSIALMFSLIIAPTDSLRGEEKVAEPKAENTTAAATTTTNAKKEVESANNPAAEKSASAKADAKKKVEPQIVPLANGRLLLPVPGNWKTVKPRSRIVKHEFSIEPAKGDKNAGRMTIMAAGGGVEANIARWVGQFQTAEGKPLDDKSQKVTKRKIGDIELHVVDLQGTFLDSVRGPFGPKVKRPDYRMLAMIAPLPKEGTWFIKFYGPKATVQAEEKGFQAMVAETKLTQ